MAGMTERQVINYIKKVAPKELAQESFQNLKPQIQIFLTEIEIITKEMERVGFIGKKEDQLNAFANKKNKERMLRVAQKAYILIEKMREYFTKEVIDYLILVEDEQISIKKGTLEQLIPTLSLIRTSQKTLRLQITSFSKIKTWKDANIEDPIKKSLTNIYQMLTSLKSENLYISTGYAFEVAAYQALQNEPDKFANDPVALSDYLLDMYKNHIKSANVAFYREGDLPISLSQKLLKESKKISLQMKRISSDTSAPLALVNTLNIVLRNAKYILKSELSPLKMVELINKYIFQAEKNLTKKVERTLKEEIEQAKKDFENSLASQNNNIITIS